MTDEAPDETVEDVEQPEETTKRSRRTTDEETGEETGERGTPAGQIALGAGSLLTAGGLGLYQALGTFGLIAGGVGTVASGGGYAYYRFRRTHPRKGRAHRDRTARSTTASHSGGKNAFGGSASRSGRRAVFGAGSGGKAGSGRRTTSRMPSLGGSSRTGKRPGGKRMAFPGGRSATHDNAGKGRRKDRNRTKDRRGGKGRRTVAARAVHGMGAPLRAVGRAGRRAGRGVARRGISGVARARAASRALDARTAHLASRTGRRVAQGSRRLGGWVNRRTGRRISAGWVSLFARLPWLARRRTPAAAPDPTAQAPVPAATTTPAPVTRTLPVRTAPMGATRRYPMSHGSPLAAISGEMVASVARYLPMDMWDVARDLDQLGQLPENVAMAVRTMTRNLEAGYPIDQRIVQMLGEFYTAIAKSSAMADEIGMAFRKIHAEDIKRKEAPRSGEHLWNV